jgi:hypothetical protein
MRGPFFSMMRTTSIIVMLFMLLSGCATAHRLELDEEGSDRLLLVKGMAVDDHGRPVPGPYLKERPTKIGTQYTIVLMSDGLPVSSFDIAVTEPAKPDFYKPFVVIGRSTAMGFAAGVVVSINILFSAANPYLADDDFRNWLNFAEVGIITGTAIGLVVGIVKGAKATAEQMHLLVLRSDETLLGYSVYEYDSLGRLGVVMSHSPQGDYDHVITTKYGYEDRSDVPASSETFSDYIRMKDNSDI